MGVDYVMDLIERITEKFGRIKKVDHWLDREDSLKPLLIMSMVNNRRIVVRTDIEELRTELLFTHKLVMGEDKKRILAEFRKSQKNSPFY